MTFVQHFLLEECFDFDQTFSNNVICVSNIVRSVLITMLGRVLLTMLQRVAGTLDGGEMGATTECRAKIKAICLAARLAR